MAVWPSSAMRLRSSGLAWSMRWLYVCRMDMTFCMATAAWATCWSETAVLATGAVVGAGDGEDCVWALAANGNKSATAANAATNGDSFKRIRFLLNTNAWARTCGAGHVQRTSRRCGCNGSGGIGFQYFCQPVPTP